MSNFALKAGGEIERSRPLRIALWVAAASVIASVLLQAPFIVRRFFEPYTVLEARMVTQSIRAGDGLVVAYKVIRRRPCRIDFDRLIVRADDGVLLYRDRVPGGGHAVGDDRALINELLLPTTTKPGRYILYSTVTNECPDGVHTADIPSLQFDVLPPAKPGPQ